jgi:alpha-tubulin suppressor-like RCC1 family protein
VVAWGQNIYGQTNVPFGLSNVVAIAAGGWHSLALKREGTIVAWGAGGPNTNTLVVCGQNVVPPGLSNVIQIAAGSVHSLALVDSGPPAMHQPLIDPTLGTNGFSVSVRGRPGHVYALQYKNQLGESAWTSLPLVAGAPWILQLKHPGTPGTQGFYRVREW